jgi:hypothetical protein
MTTYYSIFDGVCLLLKKETETTLDFRLLRSDGSWVDGVEAADHLYTGEPGAKEITVEKAAALALKLGGQLP